jgi:hypothetical protein
VKAVRDLQGAVGREALRYCARNNEQLAHTDEQVKLLKKQFDAREREAKNKKQRTFDEVVNFSKLVKKKRGLIAKGDERTLELLIETAGSTGDTLSQGMDEIGELSHVLQAVRRVEEAARTAERNAADLIARLAALEAREQAREQQARKQQARKQQARDEQQALEQQAREREQLRGWIAVRQGPRGSRHECRRIMGPSVSFGTQKRAKSDLTP